MPKRWIYAFLFLALLTGFCAAPGVHAATLSVRAASGDDNPLVIGVSACEPFVIALPNGGYTGLSVELFKQVAAEMGVHYELRAYDWDDLFTAVKRGEADAGVSCITISAARENEVDFSQAYFQTNVTAAARRPNPLVSLVGILMSREVLLMVFFLVACSALAGFLIWLIEHEINPEIYPPRNRFERTVDVFLSGATFIISGGSDYHVYKTVPGRVIAVVGKIINTVFLTGVTAIIISVLSTALLHGQINDPHELKSVRVGAVSGTSAEEYLLTEHLVYRTYDANEDLLDALEREEIDAALNDESLLKYKLMLARTQGLYHNVVIQPWNLRHEMYGFILPEGSDLRIPFDKALLTVLEDPDWQRVQDSYFQE